MCSRRTLLHKESCRAQKSDKYFTSNSGLGSFCSATPKVPRKSVWAKRMVMERCPLPAAFCLWCPLHSHHSPHRPESLKIQGPRKTIVFTWWKENVLKEFLKYQHFKNFIFEQAGNGLLQKCWKDLWLFSFGIPFPPEELLRETHPLSLQMALWEFEMSNNFLRMEVRS